MTTFALALNLAAVAVLMAILSNVGRLLGPVPRPEGDVDMPFETGMPPLSEPGRASGVLYWRFAVLFVVFDVDLAFLLPWALNRTALDAASLAAVTAFVGLLLFMLGYFWRKGTLSCR